MNLSIGKQRTRCAECGDMAHARTAPRKENGDLDATRIDPLCKKHFARRIGTTVGEMSDEAIKTIGGGL